MRDVRLTAGSLLVLRSGSPEDQDLADALHFGGTEARADLLAQRGAFVAIVRVERLYPWPIEELKAELAKFPDAKVRWVQDEPFNQGPWPSYHLNVVPQLDREVEPITRKASSTTAVGTAKRHLEEAKILVAAALD